jgi:cardiolipin synthase
VSGVPQAPEPALNGVVDRALDRATGSRLIPGNQVELLFDGPAIFPAMLARIAAAQRWIHLDSYIFRGDDTGRRFADALVERAEAGVPVRILTDWLGSVTTRRKFWRRLRKAGVQVRVFNPPQLIALRRNIVRDHRKLLVVDGKTAVIGGHCIGDEWAGNPAKGRQPWRDTACAIDGPAAVASDRVFGSLWSLLGDAVTPSELDSEVAPMGDVELRIMAGEPGSPRAARVTEHLLDGSEQRIWITDAYFVAPRGIYQGLMDAARAGLDVRLLVPGTSDLSHLQNLTRIGYRDLLRTGVRIFEWRGPMLHAKTLIIDGRWSRIGSTNLNLSSLLANYELDVVAENARIAQDMEAQFRRDLDNSVEILLAPRTRGRRASLSVAAIDGKSTRDAHRPGFRERRRRAAVAVWAVMAGARRSIVVEWSIALATLGILFLLLPRVMAVVFGALALWLAVSAWFETWGRERN